MSTYEIIMIFIGVLGLMISLSGLIITFLAFIFKMCKKK